MKYKDFEDFLMMKHAEQFIGGKDAMIDDFPEWFEGLDMDEIIAYGDKFHEESAKRESNEKYIPSDGEASIPG